MIYFAILVAGLVTYLPRFVGVLFAERMSTDSRLFRWIASVAYSILAALIARMIVLPNPPLAETELVHRLAAVAFGLAVFFAWRRHVFAGVVITGLSLWLLVGDQSIG